MALKFTVEPKNIKLIVPLVLQGGTKESLTYNFHYVCSLIVMHGFDSDWFYTNEVFISWVFIA